LGPQKSHQNGQLAFESDESILKFVKVMYSKR